MHYIILDTNFILSSLNFRIDFISEIERICRFRYELCIFEGTLNELKNKKFEKLAIDIIKQKNIKVYKYKDLSEIPNILEELFK